MLDVAMPRSSPKPMRSDTRDSRERLILAAERLFAERGIDGVSLREINKAAGQKNVAGLQYHFGTKKELLVAVFRHRVPGIEIRRKAMLKALKRSRTASDLRGILNAMVTPFAEQLDWDKSGKAYVRFVAQLYGHPSIREIDFASASYREAYRAAQRLLSAKLPSRLAKQRLGLLVGHTIHALADLENRMVRENRPASRERVPLFVSDLLDTVVGALTAPVSPATADLLRR
jgi:AcrR family transcriptional regulator